MTEAFAPPAVDHETNGYVSEGQSAVDAERASRIEQDTLVQWARDLAALNYDVIALRFGVHNEVDALRYGVELRRLEEGLLSSFAARVREALNALIDGQDADTQGHILSRSTMGVSSVNLSQVVKDARPKPPKPEVSEKPASTGPLASLTTVKGKPGPKPKQ